MKTNSEEVINDLLGYEGLKIIQRPDMFNFSLDSTILAYYTTINPSVKRIVDLGCGNGYIPKDSCDLAVKSIELNKLSSQIKIYNSDMKEAHNFLGVAQYDVVTSNPPYFVYNKESITNITDYLTIARHEVKVTLDEVIKEANILLKDGGTFAIVHRTERLLDIFESFRKNGIEPKRLLFVYPKISSTSSLAVFVEGKKSRKKGGLKVLPPLYVYDKNGKYTEDILKIFNYKSKE